MPVLLTYFKAVLFVKQYSNRQGKYFRKKMRGNYFWETGRGKSESRCCVIYRGLDTKRRKEGVLTQK